MNVSQAKILALFVHARRRHAELAPRVLEKQLTLAKGSVAAVEARRATPDRDRHVLAAWCGLEDWLVERGVDSALASRQPAAPAPAATRPDRPARCSRADTAHCEQLEKANAREANADPRAQRDAPAEAAFVQSANAGSAKR